MMSGNTTTRQYGRRQSGGLLRFFPRDAVPQLLICSIVVLGLLVVSALPASAQAPPVKAPNICTTDAAFNIIYPSAGTGIVSILVWYISGIINNVAVLLYNNIIGDAGFQTVIRAALTIYVAVYGILFMFGMTQSVFLDFVIRVIKLSVVAALLNPNSFLFFYSYVGVFFNDGTNWLIGVMASIALGSVAGVDPQHPFAVLDNALATLTSSKMIVTLIAILFTGPYGIIIGLLVLLSLLTFTKSVFQAIWVYLMSLVVRAFLFALAPIFLSFILFQRTRHLFDGWVNALVSSMLQPVFLFAFFAFFSQLVTGAINNIVQTPPSPPVCWMPPGGGFEGTPVTLEWWRFTVWACTNGICGYQPYSGEWGFTGPSVPGNDVFPLNITNIMIMVGLIYVMSSFVGIVPHLAKEIAGASLALNLSSNLGQFLSPGGNRLSGVQKMVGKAADRVGPGATVPRPGGAVPKPEKFIPVTIKDPRTGREIILKDRNAVEQFKQEMLDFMAKQGRKGL